MTAHPPHISEAKRKEVADIKRLVTEYPVMGVVNLETLPALMLQRMKKNLRDTVVFKVTKKRFMKIAFDQLKEKKNLDQVKEKLNGIPILIFTKQDPFKLYKEIKKSRSAAPAKPGQKAPNDLLMPAGPTPFTPGPMIGELGQLGIKTEVKEGKIHVREEKVLVKEGEIITKKVAELLTKLGIEPMIIGLNVVLTYHDGEILFKDVLDIDEDAYLQQIKEAHATSVALAMYLGIINTDTAKLLVQKAFRESKALAEKANITTSETIGKKLAEAEVIAEALQGKVPEVPAEAKVMQVQENAAVQSQETREPAQMEEKRVEERVSQVKPVHVAPQKQDVVVEDKQPIQESDMERAEKFLKGLTEKAVKVEGSRQVQPRAQQDFDVTKFINQAKDKKSRGEL